MAGFVVDLFAYAAVCGFTIAAWVILGDGTTADLRHYGNDPATALTASFWPIWVILGWGVVLVVHLGAVIGGVLSPGRHRRRKREAARGASPPVAAANARVAARVERERGPDAARKARREGPERRPRPSDAAASAPRDDPWREWREWGKSWRDWAKSLKGHPIPAPAPPRPPVPPPASAPGSSPASAAAAAGALAHRWVVAMFTDVVDSTSLNEQLGDMEWRRVLARHRETVRECTRRERGEEVGTQGDGFLVRFDAPAAAARCAVAIQRLVSADEPALRVRIGIHAGEVLEHEGDIVGRVVNVASRITDVALPGEILVSEPVADHIGGAFTLDDRGVQKLRGVEQTRHVLAVAWAEPAPDPEAAPTA